MSSTARSQNWARNCLQQEAITTCIRNSMTVCGGGGVYLKEAVPVANADDAKATDVVVCLDKSQHTVKGLLSDTMREFQGPAVIVFNNQTFSDGNWKGYTSQVGNSSKANDDQTVGQFGKGALTAYSLTDIIQVCTATKSADRDKRFSCCVRV